MNALAFNTTGYYNTASGVSALESNTDGRLNTASGADALNSNTTGCVNTASGSQALYTNTTGVANTASGVTRSIQHDGRLQHGARLQAGINATTGSYNVFLGADVTGTAADTNTIRIGLPYDGGGTGRTETFIAGIHGTQLTGPAVQVFIDANGQLGTVPPCALSGDQAASCRCPSSSNKRACNSSFRINRTWSYDYSARCRISRPRTPNCAPDSRGWKRCWQSASSPQVSESLRTCADSGRPIYQADV